jgi:sensor c-di-GMP phosphodiesterase-like protein
MSRRDEDRILHGLHYYRESLDEEFTVTNDQILWLAAHSYTDGAGWHHGEDLQSFDSSVIPPDLRKKLLISKFEVPLRYLHHRRLIKLTRTGADRAMRLHTRAGRMELWYQEHKNGFFGLVTTIAVSLITALATLYVTQRIQSRTFEPPRVIYEIEPKSQPGP